MALQLPDSVLLAWWTTAWLRGVAATDDLLDGLSHSAAAHSVRCDPQHAPPEWESLEGSTVLPLLAWLRRSGATCLSVALPVEGDPLGLGGPREFNRAATEARQAVVAREVGVGAVPWHVGAGVTWTVLPARPRPVPDLGEADRGLRTALLDALTRLERLDVASWSPEAADEVLNLGHLPDVPVAGSVPQPVRLLAARGLQALGIVDVALRDEGGAVSAAEVTARGAALLDLARAARTALTAAGSPEVWPPGVDEA